VSRRDRLWLGWLAVLLVLTGCTGIPSSSVPQVVRTLGQSTGPQATQASLAPQPGDPPTDVVKGFIKAGADVSAGHSTARQFLTTTAANSWKDNPTVILDNATINEGTFSGDSVTVPVTGHRLGQIDANGIFSPTLKGIGSGDEETFEFTLIKINGQWRIDRPPPGVLIDKSAFDDAYHQRTLYFMDPTQGIVVPDLRYSPLSSQPLATWLLAELIAGPRQELAQSVVNAVPAQVGKPSVQLGNPTLVDLPGTAQLDISGRNTLATQLAFTLNQVDGVQLNGGQLKLTDSGKPVQIPSVSGQQFSFTNFCPASRAPIEFCPSAEPKLYFVRNGAVLDQSLAPLPNSLGQPSRNFGSVALRQGSAASLQVAGLVGGNQLQIGSDQSLVVTRLPQPATSRPEWQPYTDDVWVGAGGRLYRAISGGRALPVTLTSEVGTLPAGSITAVRFSTDGDRAALVIRGPAGIGTLWMGSVVTTGSDVRLESLEPITPPALSVTDVAWAESTRLEMVAAEPGAEARVWSVCSDGSQLHKLSNANLPGPPTMLTAAQNEPTVVSAGGLIWGYDGGNESWAGISRGGAPTAGTNPVYAP